jgi:dihydropteroate synthase
MADQPAASAPARRWRLSGRVLAFGRPLCVGVVNVTDDSFFEGARSGTPERAIEDGLALVAAGFDLLDLGSVPARSGSPVPAEQEAGKLVPAISGLIERCPVPLTADTFSCEVARRALDAGAAAINDISGSRDPAMLDLVAERRCGLVLMHIEGPPRERRDPPTYADPIEHLKRWFSEGIELALSRGVQEEQLALDPGLDFDLSVDDDLEVLRRLRELTALGRPLFVSLSRKDFLGAVLAGSWAERLPAERREWATAAAATLAIAAGADLLRIHDRSVLDAIRVADRIVNG